MRAPGGSVRLARDDDLIEMQSIEQAAGQLFAAIGMALVADDDPPSLDVLQRYVRDGLAWVRTDARDAPVGYLLAEVVDGNAHLEQLSVHPGAARRGYGRDLIEYLAEWAANRGLPAITLTTYTDVPWNGPYYRRLGFRVLDEAQLTPGLRRIRRAEGARGLDRWPRAVLRREVRPPARSG